MTDYGITNIPDEDTFYIRQPHCAVSVRLKKTLVERVVYDTLWLVQVGGNVDWETGYVFGNKDEARLAQATLVEQINKTAGGKK